MLHKGEFRVLLWPGGSKHDDYLFALSWLHWVTILTKRTMRSTYRLTDAPTRYNLQKNFCGMSCIV